MTKKELAEILKDSSFRVAKTMPKIPHSYTLKEKWISAKEFERVVLAIREHGKREHWKWGKYFTYFYANGYKYWTMGNDLKKTILINRAYDENSNTTDNL
tara:strand:- start:6581 stop:6880 length:300 start_codon:yes stop_codon:yes gene_type:complete